VRSLLIPNKPRTSLSSNDQQSTSHNNFIDILFDDHDGNDQDVDDHENNDHDDNSNDDVGESSSPASKRTRREKDSVVDTRILFDDDLVT